MKRILALLIIMTMMLSACGSVTVENKSDENYILNSDTQVVTEVDLSKLNDTELQYAIEEIYARHGKVFTDATYNKYFCACDWYTPDPGFKMSDLTELEKENAAFIQQYIDRTLGGKSSSQPAETTQPATNNNTSSQPTVIVIHDEGYYYEHYTGDNTYIIPDSNTRKLSASELKGFNSNTLALIRNEIYARHGYVFQKQKYRDYFGSKQWYTPNSNFDASWLNSVEKYNVELIKSLE